MRQDYPLLERLSHLRSHFIDPKLSEKLILVLGCQRGGTTLSYMVLTAHPQIQGKDESEVDTHYPLSHQLQDAENHICFKLPTRTADLDFIRDSFPLARIVWIVRDPFSTISSMNSLKMTNGLSWLEDQAPIELSSLATLFPEIKKLSADLSTVAIGAYVWKYKLKAYEKFSKHFKATLIRFESLLEDPQSTLVPVLKMLNLKWNDTLLQHEKKHKNQVYWGNNVGNRERDVSRAMPPLNLSPQEINEIQIILAPEIKKHYSDRTFFSPYIQGLKYSPKCRNSK